jgi:hypothetical protein
MAKEFEVVDIWVGLFPSKERLERYFSETYSGDDDGTPISEFARDMGQWFYDHDFLEKGFHPEPTSDFRSLIECYSFSTSYFEAASPEFLKLKMREHVCDDVQQ